MTATFLTTNNANANISERIHESNDAQVTAGFWTADAQAAGGVNPEHRDDRHDARRLHHRRRRMRPRRRRRSSSASSGRNGRAGARPPPSTPTSTRVANYVYRPDDARARAPDRARTARRPASSRSRRASASAPTTSCDPTCSGHSRHGDDHRHRATATLRRYTFTLTATVRPHAQDNARSSRNAAGSPLLALGSDTCSGGGHRPLGRTGNATVVVNGQAAINATDVGGLHGDDGQRQHPVSADGTSLVARRYVLGNACPTDDTERDPDRRPVRVPPGTGPAGAPAAANPARGGHYPPGTYRSPSTLNRVLDPGRLRLLQHA